MRINLPQRVVIVVGLGAAIYVFGLWAMTWGSPAPFATGWTGYAPLESTAYGLQPWARLLVWLVLIAMWVVTSALVLRSPSHRDES